MGLAAGATWLAVAAISRYSSLAALVTCALTPLWMAFLGAQSMVVLGLGLAALIFLRHRDNIGRLANGSEGKIGKKG